MSLFAEIALPVPLRQNFTYYVPEELAEIVRVGVQVLVQFGKRQKAGFVVGLSEKTELTEVKPIIDIVDPVPLFDEIELEFLREVAYLNFASLGETLKSALPTGFLVREKGRVFLENPSFVPQEAVSQKILSYLSNRGNASISTLRRLVGKHRLYYYLGKLKSARAISIEYDLVEQKTPLVKRVVRSRIDDPDKLRELAVRSARNAFKKKALLYLLAEDPTREYDYSLLQKAFGSSALKSLEADGLIEVADEEILRIPQEFGISRPSTKIELTDEQKFAIRSILSSLDSPCVYLLYGVTGSGKTEVYIEIIREVLSRGKGVIYLVPEISMIPQLFTRLKLALAPERIAVFHSYLADGERYDIFRAVKEGIYRVVIGARSAVFLQLKSLGLIIVDEEHSSSYKQNEPPPYYNARDAAILKANYYSCPVILGSATPSIESFYRATKGEYKLLELSKRIPGSRLPSVEIVDLKDERASKKNFSILSSRLRSELENCLARGEKAILLLNRRGYSNLIQCNNCGYVPKCPDCGISYTYHRIGEKLLCHWCGHEERATESCPNCGSFRFRFKGWGTQRIESELRELLKTTRIFRLDRDAVSLKDGASSVLSEFANSKGGILLGTQMISKGLDFPDVTLVGVLNADIGLNLPDFRSTERTFELLAQVSGRAGRGEKEGKVIIQTFSPSSPAIQYAISQNYHTFYTYEIEERRATNFPPFSKILLILLFHSNREKVARAAQELSEKLRAEKLEVLGAAPAPIERLRGEYRYQILIRNKELSPILKTLDKISLPRTLKVKVVVDPIELV